MGSTFRKAALAFEERSGSRGENDPIRSVVDQIERRMIEDALKKHRWNKQKAAQELGLSRQGLLKKLKRFAIRD
jgi:two-component system, NtrC family, response regulator HupR/HoxA